ncbi:unnamed protein product [Auanema sp. JU1783]|nr:unnamed protein product [Auanema sp. JU1783]
MIAGDSISIFSLFYFIIGVNTCNFGWIDTWLENERIVNITHNTFGIYGECYERLHDEYLLKSETNRGDCNRCLIAFPVHENVLQYKITRCIFDEKLTVGECRNHFNGDYPLHTMFKKDAHAIGCPLQMPLSFTYTDNKGVCNSRTSSITRCSKWNRLSLNFQACPENPKRESSVSEMECIGTWQSHGQHFFASRLGTLRGEEHRCFIYERSASTVGRVGISADAGCQELTHLSEATVTLNFKQEAEVESFCEFPGYMWKHDHRKWKHDWTSMSNSKNHHVHRGSWHSHYRNRNDTVWTCLDRKDKHSEHYFRVYVHKGCQTGYQCLKVKRLRKHIIEVHYGHLSQEEFFDDCSDMEVTHRDTLVMPGHKEACSPRHRLYTPSCPDVPAISVGCHPGNLQILRSCSSLQTENFECVGHFDDHSQKLTIIRSEETDQLMCMAHMLKPINLVRIFDFRACTAEAIEGEPPSVFMNISKSEHCEGSLLAGFLSSSSSSSSTSSTSFNMLQLTVTLLTCLIHRFILV